MKIEVIKSQLQKLAQILDNWHEGEPISAIEREIALDKIKSLYELIRFDATPAPSAVETPTTPPAEQLSAAAAIATLAYEELTSTPEQGTAETGSEETEDTLPEEKEVEVEFIFADGQENDSIELGIDSYSSEEAESDIEVEVLFDDDEEEEETEASEASETQETADEIETPEEETPKEETPEEETTEEETTEEETPVVAEPTIEILPSEDKSSESESEPTEVKQPVEESPAEETPKAKSRPMSTLFGNEEQTPRPRHRTKHQRMMSIYNDDSANHEKSVDISKIFEMDDDFISSRPTAKPKYQESPEPQQSPSRASSPTKSEKPAPAPAFIEPLPAESITSRTIGESMPQESILGESIAPKAPTLAESMTTPTPALADEIGGRLRSLRDGVGLNDKFLMIRDLFDGDSEAYEKSMEALDSCESLDDCIIYIAENHAWNGDCEGAKFIMQLLERKHLS